MRKFNFDNKETYSKEEVVKLLSQHQEFVESPYLQEKFSQKVSTLLPNNIVDMPTAKSDILQFASIDMNDNDETIKKKIDEVLKARPYFLKPETSSNSNSVGSSNNSKAPTTLFQPVIYGDLPKSDHASEKAKKPSMWNHLDKL